ncbi:MAG: ribonuclease VapC [Acidobacteria bacterium]|nr:ribonuclease VapC [Acidobacteriota bacterium]
MRVFILDTSAVIPGFVPLEDEGSLCVTVREVVEEVTNPRERLALELAVEQGRLRVETPGEDALARARAGARESGDLTHLSETDLALLALALEKKEAGAEAVILTDDFDIQNLATILGIEYAPMAERGIGRVFRWVLVCRGCRRRYPADYGEEVCGVCGSPLKSVPGRE